MLGLRFALGRSLQLSHNTKHSALSRQFSAFAYKGLAPKEEQEHLLIEKHHVVVLVLDRVNNAELAITKLALAEWTKTGKSLDGLVGKGSSERGRVNVFDVHRIVHPPKFSQHVYAESTKPHLDGKKLDEAFQKSYGGAATQPASGKPAKQAAATVQGGRRRPGDVGLHDTSQPDFLTNRPPR